MQSTSSSHSRSAANSEDSQTEEDAFAASSSRLDDDDDDDDHHANGNGKARGESYYSASGDDNQKRNKHKRTRDGCLTCRKGKKACDKHRPTCERCRRLNYECTWPPIRPAPYGAPKGQAPMQSTAATSAASSSSSSYPLVPPTGSSSGAASSALPDYPAGPPSLGHVLKKVSPDPLPTPPNSLNSPALQGVTANSGQPYASSSLSSSNVASPRVTQTYGPRLADGTSNLNTHMNVNNAIDPLSATLYDGNSTDALPSTAINSNFWQDHSLYTLNYNFSDLSDIDSLLRFTGLMPENNLASGTSFLNSANPPVIETAPAASDTKAATSSQLVFPKDKIKEFSSKFSPRLSTLLNKMMAEQDNGTEIKLPLAYIVTQCLWAPSSALEGLLKAAKNVYVGQMDNVLKDLGDVAWAYLTSEPAKATQIAFPPETIANLNISLSQKCFALVDISFRELFVSGAKAYYDIIGTIEKLLLQSYKPGHIFNLAEIGCTEYVWLYNFAWSDILRAIQLGIPTTFAYHYTPSQGVQPSDAFSVGNSDAVLCIMAEISAFRYMLDRDPTARTSDGQLHEMYKSKAADILRRLQENPGVRLDSEAVDSEEALDSVQHVASIAAQEAWRQGALVHYYQSIYRSAAPYTESLQKCCRQIVQLFPITQLGSPHRSFLLYGLPVFMAATVASTCEDREACMKAMHDLSFNSVADKEAQTFLERIWAESDRLGRTVEWLEYTSVETGPAFA